MAHQKQKSRPFQDGAGSSLNAMSRLSSAATAISATGREKHSTTLSPPLKAPAQDFSNPQDPATSPETGSRRPQPGSSSGNSLGRTTIRLASPAAAAKRKLTEVRLGGLLAIGIGMMSLVVNYYDLKTGHYWTSLGVEPDASIVRSLPLAAEPE